MRPNYKLMWALALPLALLFVAWGQQARLAAQVVLPEQTEPKLTEVMQRFLADQQPPSDLPAMGVTPCVGGFAGAYPCNSVDLMAFLPLGTIGGGSGNDVWGWTDPVTGKEYALMGRSSGTSFVDITDPMNPVYLGNLPTHTNNSSWRDIKVYSDHAFVVSEAAGHGMQVFDLTQLESVITPPVTFSETQHYPGFGNAHNLAINEDTGFAYAIGSNTCSGGLHMVNIQTPASPTFAGCFSTDGYTHDTQCVVYSGPDTNYQGNEICFSSNEDTLTITDVTDKNDPEQLSRTPYTGSGYTHQGWLTEDQVYFLLDDELDEQSFGHNTRTRVWNVSDLDAPSLIGFYDGPVPSIDHNLYTQDYLAFEANYTSGVRILDITGVASAFLSEVAFFDVYPNHNNAIFTGSWSVFPYYESGLVVVSGIDSGLFVLLPKLPSLTIGKSQPSGTPSPGQTITYTITVTNQRSISMTGVTVTDLLNGSPSPVAGPDSIGPHQSAEYLYSYSVTQANCGTNLSNLAIVSADQAVETLTPSPVVTPVNCPALSIGKGQPAGTVTPGETITYTITVTNSGAAAATGVEVTDTLNGNATVISGPDSIAAGESATYLFAYTVQEHDCHLGLSNVASVSSAEGVSAAIVLPVVTAVVCTHVIYMPMIVNQ